MSYQLLDSGDGRKLESLSGVVVERQAGIAIWRRREPDLWDRVAGRHIRSDRGGGHWEWDAPHPQVWQVRHGPFDFEIKPTPFGHLGLFPEQLQQWIWIRNEIRRLAESVARPPRILNLFAYTGGSTLAAAAGGAEVTHVDAARGIVDWAARNARLNDLGDAPIRWIVEDCARFLRREIKRERRYDGVILDPPTFGRGAKGEIWKLEDGIGDLLRLLDRLTDGHPSLLHMSSHSPGFTPLVLENLIAETFQSDWRETSSGEMSVPEENSDRKLPSGIYWRAVR